jgi:hypothetical protein
MYTINAYRVNDDSADISPLNAKRNWMDETYQSHAYKCFPVTLTNSLGWGLSFPEDIEFIWDGISDSSPDHVTIIKGHKYVSSGRSNGTISFNTNIIFKTEKNISLLQMPTPNQFIEGISPFTTIISTSFFNGPLPCAWKITKPNSIIKIEANTPFITILPISLTELQNSKIDLYLSPSEDQLANTGEGYKNAVESIIKEGGWSNFYRDATNHLGESIGSHEVKSIRLSVNVYE